MHLAIDTIDATVLMAYLLGVAIFGTWMGRGSVIRPRICSVAGTCRGGPCSSRLSPPKPAR